MLMPVTLPFGLLRLLTRPNAMGSPALTKAIGTMGVTAFKASPEMSAADCGDHRYLPTYQVGCQRR